jgi:DNA ligase (NAD+)
MKMIEQLAREIVQDSQDYYDNGFSKSTDKEFDEKLKKLSELSPNHPLLSKVGHGYTLKGIEEKEKFEHPIPVGSIEKTKSLDVLRDFLTPDSTQSTKIDGNSVVAYYKKGNLFKVVTRGSDNIGIDRTAKFISILPNKIPVPGYVAVRGEAAIKKTNYSIENGFDVSVASRNATAGAISRKDDYKEVFAFVDFIAYTFIDCDSGEDLYLQHPWQNFFKVEHQKPVDETIFTDVDSFKKKYKTDYAYDADGMVFKTGDRYLAFKFEDESVQTLLLDIEWSIGKDQRLTPVAILEKVKLSGASIERASLGSYQNAITKGCWPNSSTHVVELIRAHEVIPYIVGTVSTSSEIIPKTFPKCPVCGHESVQNGEHVFCVNPECTNLDDAKLYNFSKHYFPEGLSEKIIQKFFESEEIYTIIDLLEYEGSFDKSVYGLGESHIQKINIFLEATRKELDVKVLYDSFLKSCGDRAAEKIVDSGFDLEKFLGNPEEITKLQNLSNFNSTIISDLVSKKELFREVLTLRKVKQMKSDAKEFSYCISGIRLKGEQAELVKSLGWKEESSVKKTLTCFVVKDPESTSTKTQKAKECGIPVVTVEGFMEMLTK